MLLVYEWQLCLSTLLWSWRENRLWAGNNECMRSLSLTVATSLTRKYHQNRKRSRSACRNCCYRITVERRLLYIKPVRHFKTISGRNVARKITLSLVIGGFCPVVAKKQATYSLICGASWKPAVSRSDIVQDKKVRPSLTVHAMLLNNKASICHS